MNIIGVQYLIAAVGKNELAGMAGAAINAEHSSHRTEISLPLFSVNVAKCVHRAGTSARGAGGQLWIGCENFVSQRFAGRILGSTSRVLFGLNLISHDMAGNPSLQPTPSKLQMAKPRRSRRATYIRTSAMSKHGLSISHLPRATKP